MNVKFSGLPVPFKDMKRRVEEISMNVNNGVKLSSCSSSLQCDDSTHTRENPNECKK
jgi:predicted peroxiredoxin